MRLLIAARQLFVEAFGNRTRRRGPSHEADFSPIDFSSTPDRLDTTRLNYDGTGEQQCKIKFALL